MGKWSFESRFGFPSSRCFLSATPATLVPRRQTRGKGKLYVVKERLLLLSSEKGCDAVSSSCFRSFRRNLNGSIRSRRKDCILTPKILRKRPIKQHYSSTQLSSTLLDTSTVVSCCIKHIIKAVVKSDHSKTIPLTKKYPLSIFFANVTPLIHLIMRWMNSWIPT